MGHQYQHKECSFLLVLYDCGSMELSSFRGNDTYFSFPQVVLKIHNFTCLCQEIDLSPPIATSIVWGGGRMRVT